jgi:hypothetical protein
MKTTIIGSLLLAALLTCTANDAAWCGDNGTLTLNNLIVLKDAGCLGKTYWVEADARAKNLASGQCGLSDSSKAGDWRLPTESELGQLRNLSGLTNIQQGNYWSSTCQIQMWGPGWGQPVKLCYSSSMSGNSDRETVNKFNYVLPVRPVK